jgi:altronate dehydratase large subunit
MDRNWTGFRRKNGTVGLRNYLAVIAATDAANPVARRIAASVPGGVAITPLYGRGQLGKDLEQSINTMAGLGINPNVYAALIVSLEPVAGGRVAERIAASGKPVEALSIQGAPGTTRLQQASKAILDVWAADAARLVRTAMDPGELVIGLECGGSDTTSGIVSNPAIGIVADQLIDWGASVIFSEPVECLGGEDALASRSRTPEIAAAVRDLVVHYEKIAENAGIDLNAINPAPDNIRGGLTTIEEKSLGALCKTGTRQLSGVLGYGEAPRAPGLYLMDAPAAATENITALAAGGTHAILFGTGALNSIGNPVSPTVKICGNPSTCSTMPDHVDVDLSDVVTADTSIAQAGARVLAFLRDVAAGQETRCEVLGEVEVAISRIGPSV